MQADFTNATIVRKKESEVTGLGAAIAAGLHTNMWGSLEEVKALLEV
jgi:glycerol kinase